MIAGSAKWIRMTTRLAQRPAVIWWIAIGLCIVVGFAIQLQIGLQRPSVWGDEAGWFQDMMIDSELLTIRAPAYILLHRFLFRKVFSTYEEYKIRLVSIVSGVLFLPLFVLVVDRLFRSHTLTLIGALLASFNVAVASYAHEFKPYMLELFLHTAWFYVAILIEDKRRAAIGGSFVLVVGCLFSYSFVPLLAFQLVYVVSLRARRQIDDLTVAGSLLPVLAYLAFFLFVYATQLLQNPPDYWGQKYGVFYEGEWSAWRFLGWLFAKISTYVTYPLNWFQEELARTALSPFPAGFGFKENAAVGAVFTGMALLKFARMRWDDPRLIPLYVLGGYTLAGVLRIWPLGFFRTNVFLFLYGSLAMLLLFQCLDSLKGMERATAALLVLLPSVLFTTGNAIGEKYDANIRTRDYLLVLCEQDSRNAVPVLMDFNVPPSLRFYLRYDRTVRDSCGDRIAVRLFTNLADLGTLLNGLVTEQNGAWVMAQGTSRMNLDTIRASILHRYPIVQERSVREMFLMYVAPKKPDSDAG